ncbi:MAG: ABC transporter ATP-binding protein [Chloroflexota bacterium]
MTTNKGMRAKRPYHQENLSLLKPYLGNLIALALATVALSITKGTSQVLLTPLLQLVLGNQSQISGPSTTFSFDLNNIGLSILQLVQRISGRTDRFELLVISSAAYLVVLLIEQTGSFAVRSWAMKLRLVISHSMEHRLFGHIIRLPMSFLDHQQMGSFQGRVIGDMLGATTILNNLIVDGISSLFLGLFYLVLLIRTDVRLTAIAAVAGIIQLGLSQSLTRMARTRSTAMTETNAQLAAFRQERLSTIREIKIHTAEEYEEQRLQDEIQKHIRDGHRYQVYKAIERPIRYVVNRVIILVVTLFGAWELLHGRLNTSAFVLFMYFAQNLISPISTLASSSLQLVEFRALLAGVNSLFAREQDSSGPLPIESGDFKHDIQFAGVSFAYGDLPVLRNIDLTIPKGQMVALVGHSGAGKSTLVDLLLRLYEPTGGQIEIDGVSIKRYDLQSYRRLFGVVSQSAMLFNETVHNNIAYARPDISEEDVKRAAQVANAEGFILDDLENSYQTILGERGVLLSGGQQQRIAIARAVVTNPPILILDEATSALDSEAEQLVRDAISQVVKGNTAIVIAHRLSTVLMADKIVVMRDGEIVEMGTHEQLLALGGEYTHLYNLQFRGKVEEEPT